MAIQATSTATQAQALNPATGARAAQAPSQQMDYMKLIVAQMRNLNPMDPSSGGDSLPMMMQAESLNQLAKLNTALQSLETMSQTGYAAGLIGRTVSGVDSSSGAVSGVVRGVQMDPAGAVLELADGQRLRLADVIAIKSE